MELQERRIACRGTTDPVEIIPIGDCHIGTINCDTRELAKVVKYVKDTPNAYWIGMGDYIEAINWRDKRFDERTMPDYYNRGYSLVQMQKQEFISLVEPILNPQKCLGLHCGNHEEKYLLENREDDIVGQLCWEFGLKHLSWKALSRLVFERQKAKSDSRSFIIHSHHGHGGGRKPGSKINLLHDGAGNISADIHFMGHVHYVVFDEFDVLEMATQAVRLSARQTVVATTGCFYRTYMEGSTNYAEKNGYPASTIGTVKATVMPWNDGRKLHIERLWV